MYQGITLEKRLPSQIADSTDRIYQEILRLRSEGEVAALATVIRTSGSTPGKNLFRMLVYSDEATLGSVGGGAFEAKVISEALDVVKTRAPKIFKFRLNECGETLSDDQPICGGEMEVLIEPIEPKPTIYIMGAGHVGQALAGIGTIVGFRTVVIDDRNRFANRKRFENADEVLVLNFESAALADKVQPNRSSYIVIVTRGHQHDKTVLKAFIRSDAAYIGMIGSRKKVKTVFQSLVEEGVEQQLLGRVYAPIGIDIGAQTASEIAVSIMAEIIAIAKGKINSVRPLSRS